MKCGQVAAPDTTDERDRAVAETRRTASGKDLKKKKNKNKTAGEVQYMRPLSQREGNA